MNPALRNIVLNAQRLMYPEDVKGCVLSLRADRSNLRNSPVLASGVTNQAAWSDMSKYKNDVTLTNFGGTATSGFIKAPVVSSKGIPISYTNLVTNGNFVDTTGWTSTTNANAPSASGNILTVVANGSLANASVYQTTALAVNPSGRLRIRALVKATSDKCNSIAIYVVGSTGGTMTIVVSKANPVNGTQYEISGIVPQNANFTGYVKIYIYQYYADAATASGKGIEIQQIMATDLTANTAVQALETALGRNLTAEECDRLFAFTATSASVTVDTPYSLSLDGTNDYGSLVNTPSLDITTNEFALCCTFSVGIGSGTTSLICKGLTALATDTQYALVYNSTNKAIDVYLNSAVVASSTNSSILENTFYIIIVYRDTSGNISIYINKVVNASASYATALVTRANMRIGARSTNAGGTTHASYVKGGIQTMSIYQAPSLDINKILRVEGNISKDYTGVA